jgi:diguanylate cyclase (GGDEF)-like protein
MPARDRRSGLEVAEGFERRLDAGIGRLRRGMTPGATLLFVDLDRFKQVNTTYGHPVGHEVITEVGRRLQAQARRPDDVVGRLGGDEFGLYLPGLYELDSAIRRAEDVVASLRQPIATTAGTVWIGASVGVVVVRAWGGMPSGGSLLDQADDAMYHAKNAGGGVHLFDPLEPSALRGERSEPEP